MSMPKPQTRSPPPFLRSAKNIEAAKIFSLICARCVLWRGARASATDARLLLPTAAASLRDC